VRNIAEGKKVNIQIKFKRKLRFYMNLVPSIDKRTRAFGLNIVPGLVLNNGRAEATAEKNWPPGR
jgi:hypothetical protein